MALRPGLVTSNDDEQDDEDHQGGDGDGGKAHALLVALLQPRHLDLVAVAGRLDLARRGYRFGPGHQCDGSYKLAVGAPTEWPVDRSSWLAFPRSCRPNLAIPFER